MTTILKQSYNLACLGLLCLLAGCVGGLCDKSYCPALGVWRKHHVIACDPAFGYRPTCWRAWQDGCMAGRAGPWFVDESSASPAPPERNVEALPPPPSAPAPPERRSEPQQSPP